MPLVAARWARVRHGNIRGFAAVPWSPECMRQAWAGASWLLAYVHYFHCHQTPHPLPATVAYLCAPLCVPCVQVPHTDVP
jgi:hypothetical protein